MNFRKCFWILRGIIYKVRFEKIIFPSYIGKPIFISNANKIRCGRKLRIYPGARIEIGKNNSKIIIGNNVSIGQNLHMVSYNENLEIEDNVTISGNVFISNCDHSYYDIDTSVLEQPIISKRTTIGEGTFLGYGCVILAGTNLGKHCIVGSNAVVRGSFSDYSVIVGAPARVVKKYNLEKKCWEKC